MLTNIDLFMIAHFSIPQELKIRPLLIKFSLVLHWYKLNIVSLINF